MTIKTKKYALDQKTYINLAIRQWVRDNWLWSGVPLALILINAILNLTGVYPNYWIYVVVILLTIIYVLFWAVQFTGVSQSEQFKPMFEKYVYEIDSRHIMMKLNAKEGGMLKWDMIKAAVKDKNAYILQLGNGLDGANTPAMNPFMKYLASQMGRAQFLYLPFSIFTSESDQRFMDLLLRRKGLLAADETKEVKEAKEVK
ncbi:YcxB family protein [Fibrivirga algicola]|uniref:YcxB family protein n=1 Tax=Fibrivirga algicola TaxID=2950420 RepID=A0ABX0QL28_9BACT|nr:YcxB family protein [Fibrivirga algicola]ARK11307.1 hypothetical protein A6C57_13815 [Fibrella sp. ES10-3-2-2]NID13181.1 YcxB family protein [Fibrivirga algicola]